MLSGLQRHRGGCLRHSRMSITCRRKSKIKSPKLFMGRASNVSLGLEEVWWGGAVGGRDGRGFSVGWGLGPMVLRQGGQRFRCKGGGDDGADDDNDDNNNNETYHNDSN